LYTRLIGISSLLLRVRVSFCFFFAARGEKRGTKWDEESEKAQVLQTQTVKLHTPKAESARKTQDQSMRCKMQ
jgi:hypothetical protein